MNTLHIYAAQYIFKHASNNKVFTFDVLIVHKFKSRFLSFAGTETFRVWKKYKAGAKERYFIRAFLHLIVSKRYRLKLMSRCGSLIEIISFLFLITCCSFSSFL